MRVSSVGWTSLAVFKNSADQTLDPSNDEVKRQRRAPRIVQATADGETVKEGRPAGA